MSRNPFWTDPRCPTVAFAAGAAMPDFSQLSSIGSLDPETVAMLEDLYDRACARYCRGPTDGICDVMADKIIAAAINGERDPDTLWQIAVRGF